MTIENIVLPDMSLDLTAFRIKAPDYDYIEKHAGRDSTLEDWSQRLMQFAQVIEHYLNESRAVPDTVRGTLQGLVDDARAAEQAIRLHITSVRLPLLEDGNELMLMRVNEDATEYEVVHPSQLFSGWMQSLTVNVGGQELPVISSPNIVLPEFGEYNLNSSDDYDRFIARLGDAMRAAADAERYRNSASSYVRLASDQANESRYWSERSKEDSGESKRYSDLSMRYTLRAESASAGAAEDAAKLFSEWSISHVKAAKGWADTAKRHSNTIGAVVRECESIRNATNRLKTETNSLVDQSEDFARQSQDSSRNSATSASLAEQAKTNAGIFLSQSIDARNEADGHRQNARNSALDAEIAEQNISQYYEDMSWMALTGVMSNASSLIHTQRIILQEHAA